MEKEKHVDLAYRFNSCLENGGQASQLSPPWAAGRVTGMDGCGV